MVVCLFICFMVFSIIVIEVGKGEKEQERRKNEVNKREIGQKGRGSKKAHKINTSVRF